MNSSVLLDTHVWLWWMLDEAKLSSAARDAITQAAIVYVSAASAWEITTKHRLGKLPVPAKLIDDLASAIDIEGFVALPITIQHAQKGGNLKGEHKDPFDRLIVAQAILEDLDVISRDQLLDTFAITRVW